MASLLSNFRNTIIVSVILRAGGGGSAYGRNPHGVDGPCLRRRSSAWLHVFFGILWIGLLYYFNFVQIRNMPQIPAELKPAVSKYIAPEALFWFRWAALATWVMGVILAIGRGYFAEAATLSLWNGYERGVDMGFTFIGLGMWLATIMFINVWGVIWPNQKRALGIVEADADAKAKAASMAMLFSRINTCCSASRCWPRMTMNQTLFG